MNTQTNDSWLLLRRYSSALVVLSALGLGACSSSASEGAAPGLTEVADATDSTSASSIVPSTEPAASTTEVVVTATGLEPLGEESSYVLVSYDGDQWLSGGSFDVAEPGGPIVLEDGTTGLFVHLELPNVAVLITADPGQSQLAEQYWLADGSIDGLSPIALVDVSGRGEIQVLLEFPS